MLKLSIKSFDKPIAEHKLKEELLFTETRRAEEILKTMDEDTYEELVASWAYWSLKDRYEDVLRIGGSGDRGVDVIAYYDHAIKQSDVIGELGKFLFFMSSGDIPVPESYYLMAPQGLSSQFLLTYKNPETLKKVILGNWDKHIAGKIEKGVQHKLEGELKSFVEGFDYVIFKFYSPAKFLKTLMESGKRFVYFQYFGFRKELLRKIKLETPKEPEDYEGRYVQHLLDAYNDVEGFSSISQSNVDLSEYSKHFNRSRDEFWLAESVKKMSEENNPGDNDEFEDIKDEMEGHVADTYEDNYENSLRRVKAVTDKSATMPIKTDWVVSSQLGARAMKGICYQLSNEDRLIWKEEGKS